MPPIGALIGNTDFSSLRLDISKVRDLSSKATHVVTDAIGSGTAESVPAEPIWWNYGAFIQQCVDFAILAFCVFLMVKMMNKLMKKNRKPRRHRCRNRPRRSCCLRRFGTCSGNKK